MSLITITSDWKTKDFYLAAFKGSLVSLCPGVQIVDITHQIKNFDIGQTAYVLKSTYKFFPDNTCHLVVVDSEPDSKRGIMLYELDNQYFISKDTGLISLIADEDSEIKAYLIPEPQIGLTFPELSTFVPVAVQIMLGKKPIEFLKPAEKFVQRISIQPAIERNHIIGKVIYIDSSFNIVTNITLDIFENVRKDRNFVIEVRSQHYKIEKISEKYNDVPAGELLAVFNIAGYLEIAMRNGNAAELLSIDTDSSVRISFTNS